MNVNERKKLTQTISVACMRSKKLLRQREFGNTLAYFTVWKLTAIDLRNESSIALQSAFGIRFLQNMARMNNDFITMHSLFSESTQKRGF